MKKTKRIKNLLRIKERMEHYAKAKAVEAEEEVQASIETRDRAISLMTSKLGHLNQKCRVSVCELLSLVDDASSASSDVQEAKSDVEKCEKNAVQAAHERQAAGSERKAVQRIRDRLVRDERALLAKKNQSEQDDIAARKYWDHQNGGDS